MKRSKAMEELINGKTFSPAQKKIFLATSIKNIADTTIVYVRNYSMQLTGIADGYKLPEFTLEADPKLTGVDIDASGETILVKLPTNLNKPTPDTVPLIFFALGSVLDPEQKDHDTLIKTGVKWIEGYHKQKSLEYFKATLAQKKEIMTSLGQVAFIYLQNNLAQFVDHIKDEGQFNELWLSRLVEGDSHFDNDLNTALINVIFGTEEAQDIFKIYLALVNNPIEGDKFLNPQGAEFMSAFFLGVMAGV